MHALLGDLGELDELGLRRQAQLEPRGAQAKREERRDVYCRTET
jgi:hypothetical protein